VWQAIGDLLPSAVGVAISPVPIIAVILMLSTRRARSNGSAFAVGWVLGLVAVMTIVLLVASGADDPDSGASTAVSIVKLLLGMLFLVMAWKQWQSRPVEGQPTELPKWMASIDAFTPGRSFVVGAMLSGINPKNLALTLAAAASIAQAGLSGGATVGAAAAFVIVGSISVAGPVLFYLVASERAAGPLSTVKQYMSDHNAVIMMVVLLVLGAKLIGNGLAGLAD
jgi:threonine/homoserine/homoserine lactone efflux protein